MAAAFTFVMVSYRVAELSRVQAQVYFSELLNHAETILKKLIVFQDFHFNINFPSLKSIRK
jgi:hypothetical protein